MTEAFVRTVKHDCIRVSPLPDARTMMEGLPLWIEHYNNLHPLKALGYHSLRKFIADQTKLVVSDFSGVTTTEDSMA